MGRHAQTRDIGPHVPPCIRAARASLRNLPTLPTVPAHYSPSHALVCTRVQRAAGGSGRTTCSSRRRPSLMTYKLRQSVRHAPPRAARGVRLARSTTPLHRRADAVLLDVGAGGLPVRQLWPWRPGEAARVRPAGCAGGVGSRSARAEAALGSAGRSRGRPASSTRVEQRAVLLSRHV